MWLLVGDSVFRIKTLCSLAISGLLIRFSTTSKRQEARWSAEELGSL